MQIDIISPEGKLTPYPLDPQRGIANIGRNWANEIVLNAPDVAEFHAWIDYRQMPYRIASLEQRSPVKLNGMLLPPGSPVPLQPADTVELGGYQLLIRYAVQIVAAQPVTPLVSTNGTPVRTQEAVQSSVLIQSGQVASQVPLADQPSTEWANGATVDPEALFLGTPLPHLHEPIHDDSIQQLIGVNIIDDARNQTIEAGESAVWRIEIVNGGRNVGLFYPQLQVWHNNAWLPLSTVETELIQITPALVNLNEDSRQTITIRLTPPRHYQSWAGYRRLRLQVTSPTYPGIVTTRGLSLRIKPYNQFQIDPVNPQTKTIPYRTRTFPFTIQIHNLSNSSTHFDVTGIDAEQRCTVEFDEPGKLRRLGKSEIILRPGDSQTVTSFVTPKERRFLGSRSNKYDLTFSIGLHARPQTAQTVKAALTHRPRLPYWILAMMGALLLLGVILITAPEVAEFKFTGEAVKDGTVMVDSDISLNWSVSSYGGPIRIDPITEGKPVILNAEPKGILNITSDELNVLREKGINNLEYEITARHWISRLPLIPDEWLEYKVESTNKKPRASIQLRAIDKQVVNNWITSFNVNPLFVAVGEPVKVTWDVNNAPDPNLVVELRSDRGVESLEHSGEETFFPEVTTSYTLVVASSLGSEVISSTTVIVSYTLPIGTFDASPRIVNVGQSITIRWNIESADRVEISGASPEIIKVPIEPATLEHKFDEPGTYILAFKAINESPDPGKSSSGEQTNFAPIVITVLRPSKIIDFRVFPAEVVLGSAEAKNVEVRWRVDAEQAEIELSGIGNRPLTGLARSGAQKVEVGESSQSFELLVRDLDGSEEVSVAELTVLKPTPTPTAPPSPTPAPIPPPEIEFYAEPKLIESGGDFDLFWIVSNNPTRIEITSSDYPTIISTNSNDSVTLNNAKSTSFTLTAFRDGTAVATKTILLKPQPPPPTPSPVPPPPRIINFTVAGDSVRLDSSNPNSAEYTADIGTDVTLSWQVENIGEVSLEEDKSGQITTFSGLGAAQSLPRRLTQKVIYRLIATGAPANYTVEINVNAPPPPPPPKNIAVTITSSETARVTWDYTGDPDLIVGFRIYRADVGSAEFTRRADELSLKNTDSQWIDDRTPVCSKVYYVVAVYEDKSQDPPVKRETSASESFNTLPCL